MNTKIALAILLAFLTYFFSGWGVYSGLLNNLFTYPEGLKEVVLRPDSEFKISHMALSCLITGSLLTFLIYKMGIHSMAEGAKLGAITLGLTALAFGLGGSAQYAFGSVNNAVIDMIGSIITGGLTGGVIGWWMGRK